MQKILSASLLALAMIAPAAQAYQAGDIVLRAGIATVSPNEDSSDADVGLDSDTQLGLTAAYMVTNNIGIELLAATPFQHTVSLGGADIADIEHLPPTLSVQYFPLAASSKFQPYVGVGLNYTTFFREELTSTGKAAGLDSISLDDSFGLAVQAGFDYALNDNIVLNAAVWRIDLETTATAKTTAGGEVKIDVDVDPWAYMVGLGYKF